MLDLTEGIEHGEAFELGPEAKAPVSDLELRSSGSEGRVRH